MVDLEPAESGNVCHMNFGLRLLLISTQVGSISKRWFSSSECLERPMKFPTNLFEKEFFEKVTFKILLDQVLLKSAKIFKKSQKNH